MFAFRRGTQDNIHRVSKNGVTFISWITPWNIGHLW